MSTETLKAHQYQFRIRGHIQHEAFKGLNIQLQRILSNPRIFTQIGSLAFSVP